MTLCNCVVRRRIILIVLLQIIIMTIFWVMQKRRRKTTEETHAVIACNNLTNACIVSNRRCLELIIGQYSTAAEGGEHLIGRYSSLNVYLGN